MTVRNFLLGKGKQDDIKPSIIAKRLGITRQAAWETLERQIDTLSISTIKKYSQAVKIKLNF